MLQYGFLKKCISIIDEQGKEHKLITQNSPIILEENTELLMEECSIEDFIRLCEKRKEHKYYYEKDCVSLSFNTKKNKVVIRCFGEGEVIRTRFSLKDSKIIVSHVFQVMNKWTLAEVSAVRQEGQVVAFLEQFK